MVKICDRVIVHSSPDLRGLQKYFFLHSSFGQYTSVTHAGFSIQMLRWYFTIKYFETALRSGNNSNNLKCIRLNEFLK